MTGKIEKEEQIKSVPPIPQIDQIVMRANDLKVWPESDAVNFELHKGEILGVTGLDGHGQDDFVKMLAGVSESYAGKVEVRNNNNQYVKFNTLMEAKTKGFLSYQGIEKKKAYFPT